MTVLLDTLQIVTPAMALFTLATTAAPGPNAALMLAVGSRLGRRGGVPALLGLATANAVLKGTIAASIGILAYLDPMIIEIGRWVVAALTVCLAWRLMRRLGGMADDRCITGFWDAFAFQLVNPKTIINGAAAATLFSTPGVSWIGHALAFFTVAFPSVLLSAGPWLVVGHSGATWLRGPRAARVLNLAVGITLILTLAPVLLK